MSKNTFKHKAKLVLHHDDPPCDARLEDGFCLKCNFTPDMQSICLYCYCPSCNIRLTHMRCCQCGLEFKSGS